MPSLGRKPKGLPSKEEKHREYEDAGGPPVGWKCEAPLAVPDWKACARWVGWYYYATECAWPTYQARIDEALRANALSGLDALWSGVYYHDRDNPDFERDLLTAARCSDEDTFLFALYARTKYSVLNWYENRDFEAFAECIEQNPALSPWWGSEGNQRALYDLLGSREVPSWSGSSGEEDKPWPPLAGSELGAVIQMAAEAGDHRTARILAQWGSA